MPNVSRRFLYFALVLVFFIFTLLNVRYRSLDGPVSKLREALVDPAGSSELSLATLPATAHALSRSTQQLFQQTWFEDPPAIDLPNLRAQCERTEWREDVYIQCGGLTAGLTTIISGLRVCFRMALDAGVNLVIPAMALRSSDKLDQFNTFDEKFIYPYSEWFDEEHLISALESQCPQMKIARLDKKKAPRLPSGPWVHLELDSAPGFKQFEGWAWPGRTWHTWFLEQGLPAAVEEYKSNLAKVDLPVPKGPTVVSLFTPFLFFRITEDTTGHDQKVWHELNSLIRYNKPSRRIVGQLMDHIKSRPYIGIHYRGEKDNIWSSPEVQLKRDLEMAESGWALFLSDLPSNRLRWGKEQVKTIYLACGDQDAISQFKAEADKRGWTIIDKWSMAKEIDNTATDAFKSHDRDSSSRDKSDEDDDAAATPSLVNAIDALPFDHQGSIDLALVTMSTFFIGFTGSAFGFTVANARDPAGRYRGSTMDRLWDEGAIEAKSHLFNDGESGQYPCCF